MEMKNGRIDTFVLMNVRYKSKLIFFLHLIQFKYLISMKDEIYSFFLFNDT